MKSLAELQALRDKMKNTIGVRDDGEQYTKVVVGMATCGIAAGAKEVMSYFIEAFDRERVDALVTQTGCMGYCYAEPTVEITVPGKEPIVFGRVNKAKVDEIITCYIKQGILLDDIIPVNYNAVGPE